MSKKYHLNKITNSYNILNDTDAGLDDILLDLDYLDGKIKYRNNNTRPFFSSLSMTVYDLQTKLDSFEEIREKLKFLTILNPK